MTNLAPTSIAILAVVLLIVGVLLAVNFARRQQATQLRKRFGPEYDRAMDEMGDEKEVQRMLSSRLDHVKSLDIRSLSADEAARFSDEWRLAQAQFVDEPLAAVQRANHLIRDVMSTRGYPVDDFEQRAADISVTYPALVENYRALHALASRDGAAPLDTEEMRQAMLHARALFDELVREESVEHEAKETV